jgi:hypothetical protein
MKNATNAAGDGRWQHVRHGRPHRRPRRSPKKASQDASSKRRNANRRRFTDGSSARGIRYGRGPPVFVVVVAGSRPPFVPPLLDNDACCWDEAAWVIRLKRHHQPYPIKFMISLLRGQQCVEAGDRDLNFVLVESAGWLQGKRTCCVAFRPRRQRTLAYLFSILDCVGTCTTLLPVEMTMLLVALVVVAAILFAAAQFAAAAASIRYAVIPLVMRGGEVMRSIPDNFARCAVTCRRYWYRSCCVGRLVYSASSRSQSCWGRCCYAACHVMLVVMPVYTSSRTIRINSASSSSSSSTMSVQHQAHNVPA